MKRLPTLLAILLTATCTDSLARGQPPAAGAAFTISIDEAMFRKFGFQYPATYVFRLADISAEVQVRRRDGDSRPWTTLEKKTTGDFYSGIECVRFDKEASRAYVSVGFNATNAIELEFLGARSAEFDSVARYYDGRKAAYTLSNDNWGCNAWAHPGAPWCGPTDDESDNYQAALHVCRGFHLPLSIAINSRSAGGESTWRIMQEELDRGDRAPSEGWSWEPAVHGQTHPKDAAAYQVRGYRDEILGCREDILKRLHNIPYGQYVFEHILTHGYQDETLQSTDAGEFLFLRGFNWLDNPSSNDYSAWNKKYRFYGIGGLNTKGYDALLERREPKGRYYARDVAELNAAFDKVYQSGGIFYALWHPDRFRNSVIYDPRPGIDGKQGSTLVQHLAHVANRKDVWYVANGWLYSYRYVAQSARVASKQSSPVTP
jgi:hypothetical protein